MKPINEFITEMTRDEVIKIIRDNRPNTKNFRLTTRDGKSQNARLFVSQDGYPAYFSGRSRTRGYRLSDSQCDQLESVTPLGVHNEASERVKYLDKRVKRALGYLKSSGFWKTLAETFQNYLKLSDAEREEFAEYVYDGKLESLKSKYGWLQWFESSLFENIVEKRGIKTVNYYSDEKDEFIAHLKEAVNSRKVYRYRWTKGYDNMVAVSHSSDYGLVGHYSEEYRGTGNGHYYILLDFEHALFGEDD